MDFFAGSGTTGAVCLEFNRHFILDNNAQAMESARRFSDQTNIEWIGDHPQARLPETPRRLIASVVVLLLVFSTKLCTKGGCQPALTGSLGGVPA